MWEDPVVKEVRKARFELEQEADNDLAKLYQRALKVQDEVKTTLVSEPLQQATLSEKSHKENAF